MSRLHEAWNALTGKEPPRRGSGRWYSMRAVNEEKAEIDIYDIISPWWGMSARKFRSDLKALGDVSEIDLRVHCEGGDIFEGFAIFNAIADHPAKVTTYVDGLAASMGSVVAMAGDRVVMAENSYMMIHNPWAVALGEADDLRRTADLMDNMRSKAVAAYRRRSTMSDEELIAAMDAETWYDADEALAVGLCDEVGARIEIAASANLSAFEKVPEGARKMFAVAGSQRVAPHQKTEEPEQEAAASPEVNDEEEQMNEEMKILLEKLQGSIDGLSTRIGEVEKTAQDAVAGSQRVVEDTKRGALTGRLERLVAAGKVDPVTRDAVEEILAPESGLDLDRAEAFLAKLEARQTSALPGALTQEITTSGGARKSVPVSRLFTAPKGESGVQAPDPTLLAIHEEVSAEAKGYDDYRRRAYEAHGQALPGLTDPWAEN